ncbi:Bridging integrator 3 -like protein [Halotydeus destructor]|nr:Bridging integrator 3 -like protein [Halotydeus destructor]
MSWNLFHRKGSVPRGSSAFMGTATSSSAPQKDSNNEVNKHAEKLFEVDMSASKMKKEAKKLNECIIALNRTQCKLTDDLSNSSLCQQYEPNLRAITEEWHTFNRQLTNCSDDLSSNIQRTVLEPTKKLQGTYKDVKAVIKKRDQYQQEISNLSIKVAKLSEKEKTGQNLVQLEKAKQNLAASEEGLRRYDALIDQELPLLLDARRDYFQPSLEAFIKSEALFWGDTIDALNNSPLLSSVQAERAPNWNVYTQRQEELMNRLSSLSIVEGSS